MRIQIYNPQQNKINIVELPNFEYLPLFYLFPKALLEAECPSLADMPRSVHGIFTQEEWCTELASDYFLQAVIDLTANFVWPAFGISTYMECFSGYDPIWRLAHALPLWQKAFEHMSGITPQSLADDRKKEQEWVKPDEFYNLMPKIGIYGILENNLIPCIQVIREMRCFEDYDNRKSNAKIDFYRKWYHTRTKTSSVSLDSIIESSGNDLLDNQLFKYVSDPSADFEESVCAKIDADNFYNTLNPRDHKILEMRADGATYQEIADKLGYSTHSAVLKRIRRIATLYLDYTDEQDGIRDNLKE